MPTGLDADIDRIRSSMKRIRSMDMSRRSRSRDWSRKRIRSSMSLSRMNDIPRHPGAANPAPDKAVVATLGPVRS